MIATFHISNCVLLMSYFCISVIELFNFRGHPKVRRIDMLHASDYSNMQMGQMSKKVEDAKTLDKFIVKAIE